MSANKNGAAQTTGGSNPELPKGVPPAPIEAPKTAPETLMAEVEAGVKHGVDAKLSLKDLRRRTEKREYDAETPRLIGEVMIEKPLEQQEAAVSALSDVSLMMLATILYNNNEVGNAPDIKNFDNVPLLAQALGKTNPRPAEVAAYKKLCELRDNPEAALTQEFKKRWPGMVEQALQTSRDIRTVASLNLREKLEEDEKWTVKGFVHEYPKTSAAIAVGGAVGAFFLIRGIYNKFFAKDEKPAEEKKKNDGAEKEKSAEKPSSWLKWALGGALAVFGFGAAVKYGPQLMEWLDKNGLSPQAAWARLFGENPERAQNKALYERMSKRIGTEMGAVVTTDFLQDMSTAKAKDFLKDDNFAEEAIEKYILDSAPFDAVGGLLGKIGLNTILTKEKRLELKAIRAYLKGNERQRVLASMTINDETTLGEVMVKIDEGLNRQEGLAVGNALTPPPGKEANPEDTEARMLPFLKEHYGEVPADDYRKISLISYRDFVAWRETGSMVKKATLGLQAAAAVVGMAEKPTEEEQRVIKSEELLRRFLRDNNPAIEKLSLPAGTTVGTVIKMLGASGETLKVNEPVAHGEVSNSVLPASLDVAAKRLPEESFKTYEAHRDMLAELKKEKTYLDESEITTLIIAGSELSKKIHAASIVPGNTKRAELQHEAAEVEKLGERLQQARDERAKALAAYTDAIDKQAPQDKLQKLFEALVEKNQTLNAEFQLLEDNFADKQKWTAVGVEFSFRALRRAYVWHLTPRQLTLMTKHYYGRFGLPKAFITRAAESIARKKLRGIDLAIRRVAEGESRLRGSLGGADITGASPLAERARLGAEATSLTTEEKVARGRYETELKLFIHDKRILAAEQELAELTAKAKALREGTVVGKRELEELEKKIAEKVADIKILHTARLPLEKNAVAGASEEVYSRLAKRAEGGALAHEQWREIDDLARRGAEHCRNVEKKGLTVLEDLQVAATRGAPKEEILALQKSFNETSTEIVATQKTMLERFGAFCERRLGRAGRWANAAMSTGKAGVVGKEVQESIRAASTSPQLTGEETKQFRKVLAKIFHWQKKSAVAEGVEKAPSFMRTFKGKACFYGLTLGIVPAVVGMATKDEKTSYGAAAGQAVLDMAPITGTVSDFATMFKGKELISGRQVTGLERWLMRPAFGVVGLASDVLLIVGIGAGMRAGLVAMKGGIEAARLARLATAVRTGVKVGGEAMARAGGKAVATESGSAVAAGVREAEQIIKAGTTAQRTKLMEVLAAVNSRRLPITLGIVGLTVAGASALQLSVEKQAEVEIPGSIKTLAGVQDIDPDALLADAANDDEEGPDAPSEGQALVG